MNPGAATDGSSPLLVLISAPSGAGKTTLCHQLLQARPGLTRAVTCTTRPARPGEREGVDYYFLDADRFQQRVAAGEFLEHAQVYGHGYGTLQAEVMSRLRQGRDVLLNVDVQGAATIRARARLDPELGGALVTVFLTPPTLAILEERLRRRGTEAEATIQQRLGFARRELADWRHFDYLILSTTIAEDLQRMQAILEAEHLRQKRALAPGFDAEPVEAP